MALRTFPEVIFACHSRACRPPTSGGTGGSSPSGTKVSLRPRTRFKSWIVQEKAHSALMSSGLKKGMTPAQAGAYAASRIGRSVWPKQ